MTVIAALVESDDALLLAADSGETQMPGQLRSLDHGKLHRHPVASLAWAATGDVQIGQEFTAWLQAFTWPPESWEAFRDQAAEHLASLNGRRRALAKLTGVEPGENELATVLIAGWLDRPAILELDDRGGADWHVSREFRGVGSGGPHAWIAYQALGVVRGPSPLQKLAIAMQIAASSAQMCSLPVHTWRITRDAIDQDVQPQP